MAKLEAINGWLEITRKYLDKYQSTKIRYEDGREFGLMTVIQLCLKNNNMKLLDEFNMESIEREELINALVNLIENNEQDQFLLKVVNHIEHSESTDGLEI